MNNQLTIKYRLKDCKFNKTINMLLKTKKLHNTQKIFPVNV